MNDRVKLKKLEIGAHVSESCFASLQQAHYEHFQALVQKHTNVMDFTKKIVDFLTKYLPALAPRGRRRLRGC